MINQSFINASVILIRPHRQVRLSHNIFTVTSRVRAPVGLIIIIFLIFLRVLKVIGGCEKKKKKLALLRG